MEVLSRCLLVCVFFKCALISTLVGAATYNVRIRPERANVVDKNFLSFTVDPKHLFSNIDSGINSECSCMASLLAPAYLRIAGPSTNHMTFRNTTIAIDSVEDSRESLLGKILQRDRQHSLEITDQQWQRFVSWAQKSGFHIVFALSNGQKTDSGLWDTNSTMAVLSSAEKANITDISWQLGYECTDQSIDEYLNDLETLKLVVESISSGRGLGWRALGGDVSRCCRESKSDFKDYVTLSLDMMDAVMLDGNSSYQELALLSSKDREGLMKKVHDSNTPLWLAEAPRGRTEFQRAADWAASLGHAARSGFSVHFRELVAEELYQPTLSFYMAFLFKELVGDIALFVESNSDSTATDIFAHCTSLRRKRVPGAVTVYGVNRDEEPARVSLRLSEREDGGEIMQFILNHNENGQIVVNGRVMSKEGDIRPVLKKVRPFKNLVINLPPKSFGFWVLAKTNIKECHRHEDRVLVNEENSEDKQEKVIIDEDKRIRNKRSALVCENYGAVEGWKNSISIDSFNNELDDFEKSSDENKFTKVKRQIHEKGTRKSRRQVFGSKLNKSFGLERKPVRSIVHKIIKNTKHYNKSPNKLHKILNLKKAYRNLKEKQKLESPNKKSRSKRSIVKDYHKKNVEYNKDFSKESEMPWEVLDNIISKVKTVLDSSPETHEVNATSDEFDKLLAETELSNDSASMNVTEIPDHSIIKDMLEKMFSIVTEFNRNIRKLCETLSTYTEI